MLKVLSNHFGSEVEDFVISKSHTFHARLMECLVREMNLDYKGNGSDLQGFITGANKIPAIKALRVAVAEIDKTTFGLADAKWAVENWATFYAFIKSKGRLPKIENHWDKALLT